MKKLDNSVVTRNTLMPKKGQRELLSSNRVHHRCPFLGIKSNDVSEDVALDYLASILVEAFLDKKEYERNQTNKSKEGSPLLSSINQGASG